MHLAVIGGKLQGLEAVYLAGKAGWHVSLIDKRPEVPARQLSDNFFCLNVNQRQDVYAVLRGVDLIVPALENRAALEMLERIAEELNVPLAFDPAAYDLSASKKRSDLLLAEIGIAAPRPWPGCSFPVIAKPSGSSGSEGILLIKDEAELKLFWQKVGPGRGQWVVQEYLEGPSYSIEVVGRPGDYKALEVTKLEMDGLYDCKRVLAPTDLSAAHRKQFADMAVKIAESIDLKGIMDVEVILHQNELKVLEIDARLPSQTPIAVYHSTGINMLELLAEVFLKVGSFAEKKKSVQQKAVIFEHIVVTPASVTVAGEHVISLAGPLAYQEGFFGADEALTDYRPGKDQWTATLINTGKNSEEASLKRKHVLERIMGELSIKNYRDPLPVISEFAKGDEV